MPLGDGKLLGALVGARFPIAAKVIELIGPEIIRTIQQQPVGKTVTEVAHDIAPAVERIVKENPTIKNDLNLEHPVQSRVLQGTIWGMVMALGAAATHLISMAKSFDLLTFDYATAGMEIGAIVGLGYAIYGRLKGGLQPLNFLWLFGKK